MNWSKNHGYAGTAGAYLNISISTTGTNVTNNTTTEKVVVRFVNPGSSWIGDAYTATLSFNGVERTKAFSYGANANFEIFNFTQTITHNTDGNKTVTLGISDNRYNSPFIEYLDASYQIVLDKIPRQTKITSYYLDKVDFTSYRVNWVTSDTIDQVQVYSSREGWVTIWTGSATSGNWTRTGLAPRRVIWNNN